MSDILTVSGLNKSYSDFSLQDVKFSLPEGCITGFIGINGAGKTTTLRAILGLTGRLSGSIRFFGLDLDTHEREIKDRIGIVLDEGCFYEELTLSEMKNIISSAYTSWSEQDFKRYLEMFSLDPLIRSQLLKTLIEYMKKGGKGVFFSTHITSDLDKIADTLIMIDNGRIIFQEEKDTLLDTYRIVKGDSQFLTADVRKLFLSISETEFGFTGITKRMSEVRSYIPDVVTERPSIEDIIKVFKYIKNARTGCDAIRTLFISDIQFLLRKPEVYSSLLRIDCTAPVTVLLIKEPFHAESRAGSKWHKKFL